jgi:hypothetical protein
MIDHQQMCIEFRYASANNEMRLKCREDFQRFYLDGGWWSGSWGKQFANKPKPEFNRVWRDINRIVGSVNDMEFNAVIASNSEDATDEGAELLQRRWRNDFMTTEGVEANETSTREALIGGMGALKVVSKYEDEEDPDPEYQYLCLEPISSACSSVFFDSGAIKKDKSDAKFGWHLIRVNRRMIEDEFGEDNITSFMNPVWDEYDNQLDFDNSRDIYLAHYYELVEKTLVEHDFTLIGAPIITSGDGITDNFGNKYTREELKELKEMHFEQISSDVPIKRRKVKYVEYALADGNKYLTKAQKQPFKRIPIIPRYAYYTEINGKEYYCGEVRKRTDAEMFHNMFGSAMMEVMSKPQVSKPEYLPEQVARHANQRARADIDNAPYVLSDSATLPDGSNVVGPIGQTQPPQIGTGLAAAGQFLEGQIQQTSAIGANTTPANTSGEAIQQINERQDDTVLPAIKNITHSIKAACTTWIPAAQKLYFSKQRMIRVQEVDGNYAQVQTLEMVSLPDGRVGPYGNNPTGKYSVSVRTGEAYKDSRNAQRQTMMEMLNYVGSDTEFGQMIAMNAMMLTDGEGGDKMREVAKYKMIDLTIAQGIPYEPESEEEAAYIENKLMQMQQMQQQQMMNDPVAIQAQAQAQLAEAETIKAQADVMDKQIDQYNAETNRAKVVGELQYKGVKLNQDQIKLQLDAVNKAVSNNRI